MYLNPFFEKITLPINSIEKIITHPTSMMWRVFIKSIGRSGKVSIEKVIIDRIIKNWINISNDFPIDLVLSKIFFNVFKLFV